MSNIINYDDGLVFESNKKTLDKMEKEAQSIIDSKAECEFISDRDVIRTILTVLGFDEDYIGGYVDQFSPYTGQMCIDGKMKRVKKVEHINITYTYEVIES